MVINSSASGSTTRQALERMPYEVQSHHPDLIMVQFGMNDCNYWETDRGLPRVCPKAFAANLEEIVARAHAFGAKKIFLNTNHPSGHDEYQMPYTNITYQQSNEEYNSIIRQVAKGIGSMVILNDMENVFKASVANREQLLQLLLPDKLHLSEAGHDLYFSTIYSRIKEAICDLVVDSRERRKDD
jgi:acyl-CoA thioesterase-1